MNDFNPEIFLRTWADAIQRVLDELRSMQSDPNFVPSSNVAARNGAPLWMSFRCTGCVEGGAAFCMLLDDAIQLAGVALGQEQEDVNQLTAALLDALQKVFRQFAAVVSSAVETKLGAAVEIEFEGGGEPKWKPAYAADFSFQFPDGRKLSFSGITNAQLYVSAASQEAAKTNLELLREVKLNVSLRFGQRQLLLKEVLALDMGAVIELDKQIESAVDLLLGDRVIARGDVVVVDGNYGLRVTEVIH